MSNHNPNHVSFAPEAHLSSEAVDLNVYATMIRAALDTSPHTVGNAVRVTRVTATELDIATGLYEQGDGELAWSGGEGSIHTSTPRGDVKAEYSAADLWAGQIDRTLTALAGVFKVHYGTAEDDLSVIRIECVEVPA